MGAINDSVGKCNFCRNAPSFTSKKGGRYPPLEERIWTVFMVSFPTFGFPNRVIYRAQRRFIDPPVGCSDTPINKLKESTRFLYPPPLHFLFRQQRLQLLRLHFTARTWRQRRRRQHKVKIVIRGNTIKLQKLFGKSPRTFAG